MIRILSAFPALGARARVQILSAGMERSCGTDLRNGSTYVPLSVQRRWGEADYGYRLDDSRYFLGDSPVLASVPLPRVRRGAPEADYRFPSAAVFRTWGEAIYDFPVTTGAPQQAQQQQEDAAAE